MVENITQGISLRFTPKGDKPLNQLDAECLEGLNKPIKPLNYSELRKAKLNALSRKQSFRVAIGKSNWIDYNTFDIKYNLREILKDEIVIEFDCEDPEIVSRAISDTGINLVKAYYEFEYWDHGGKSPHLHIHDLPIGHFEDVKRTAFKKIFIKKYVPQEYHKYVDFSLTGIHLIALEWADHWKGKYGVKKLIAGCEGGIYK